jgi:hypothetical protein
MSTRYSLDDILREIDEDVAFAGGKTNKKLSQEDIKAKIRARRQQAAPAPTGQPEGETQNGDK